jgi:hypothetical protein
MKHALLILISLATSVLAYERLQGPTELLYWDKTNAYNGYTLFGSHGTTYLIDMSGQVIHTWRLGTNPRFLDNGHILDASKDDPSGFLGFVEVDWDGKKVWEYTENREGYAPHHDWVRVFNKQLNAWTTMYIANKSISHEQAIAAGADPRKGPYAGGQMDTVVEVDMDGNVVWEWWFFDHVVQDVDPAKPNYVAQGKKVSDYPNRIDLNMPGKPLKRDWLHCNSMDYNAELDQVVVNSVQGELYVIDHGNTFVPGDPKASLAKAAGPAGGFLYRFGDPARYGQGEPPRVLENWDNATSGHKQMGGSHDVQWIRPGLPGAGHLMIFAGERQRGTRLRDFHRDVCSSRRCLQRHGVPLEGWRHRPGAQRLQRRPLGHNDHAHQRQHPAAHWPAHGRSDAASREPCRGPHLQTGAVRHRHGPGDLELPAAQMGAQFRHPSVGGNYLAHQRCDGGSQYSHPHDAQRFGP